MSLQLLSLLLLATVASVHGAVMSTNAKTLQEIEQRMLNDDRALRNDIAALNALMRHQGQYRPTNRPPMYPYRPTNRPPMYPYRPTNRPPMYPYRPTNRPPVHQYRPTNRPPVYQNKPTNRPPVHQYRPTNRPPVHQYSPTNRPPVYQNKPTNRRPMHQYRPTNRPVNQLGQYTRGSKPLKQRVSAKAAQLSNNSSNVFVSFTCRHGVCVRHYTAGFYSTVSAGGLFVLLVLAAIGALAVARRRRAIAEFSVMSDVDSRPLLGGGGGGVIVGRGLSVQSDPVVLARV